MVVTYVGSFPPDPKADAENFQRKQTEYEAAYRLTKEPFALYEALLNADAYLQFPAELNWLVEAMGELVMRARTDDTAKRFRERMQHVQRYRRVRDLRLQGHTKNRALELAAAELEAADQAIMQKTIENSYDRVNRELKRAGQKSEFFWLVARSDPTKVPVLVTQLAGGGVAINGIAQRSPRRARSLAQRSGVPIVSSTVGWPPTVGGGTDR